MQENTTGLGTQRFVGLKGGLKVCSVRSIWDWNHPEYATGSAKGVEHRDRKSGIQYPTSLASTRSS